MAYQKGRRPGGGRRQSGARRNMRRRGPRKENIHPSKFVKAAKPSVEQKYIAKHKFDDFKVDPLLHKNIVKKGFVIPSPIQDQSIPVGLEGHDVIGIANTGTGKTVAFAIPVLQRLLTNRSSRVLIMAPTRELAGQILDEIKTLCIGSGLHTALLIGGAKMGPQLRELAHNPQIVVGTPGRIKDHSEKKKLQLQKFDTVVLDEVDRMLDMGFVNDMRTILGKMKSERQSFFFSATMDDKVRTLIKEFSKDPKMISVKTGVTSDNVEQSIVQYKSNNEKIDLLHDILVNNRKGKMLIFDETKRGVNRLTKDLCARGFQADAIHGNKSQGQRQRALNKFKNNHVTILVATDVAARGIDVVDITHVINYETPQSYTDYVHRIGRAGRAGRTGHAMTFVPHQHRGGGGGKRK